MRTRIVVSIAVLLAVGSLAACSGDPDVDAGRNRGAVIASGDQYVALGDSYTAGGLLGETTGPALCVQSNGNYPNRLAAALSLDLVDASCGGATTKDLGKSQDKGVDPQFDALTEDTQLVTLGIGANDNNMVANVVVGCVSLAIKDPEGRPCTEAGEQEKENVGKLIAELAERLTAAIGEILERSPDARIIVVGYPQMIPATGSCAALPLAKGDYPAARELMNRINGALEGAAAETGAEYLDVWTATEGHDICAADPWVAGAAPEPGRPGFAYHPYAEEQQAVAALLEKQLAS